MNWQEMLINSGLVAALIGLVLALIKLAGAWVGVKVEQLKQRIGNEKLNQAIDVAYAVVSQVVQQTAQELGDDLKAKTEDGKLTEEEKVQLKETALYNIKRILKQEVKEVLKEVFDDPDIWISSAVEAEVRKLK